MPFGKHRGVPLSELPGGYLAWLGGKLDDWREPFRSVLAAELARRSGETLPGVANDSPQTPAPRAPARRRASESPASTVCDVCGLGPTAQKPLVHASCVTDEVPF
jgi:Putative quorum-sensing-regulated virulence factor